MNKGNRLIFGIMLIMIQGCLSKVSHVDQLESPHKNYLDFVIRHNSIFAIDSNKDLIQIKADNSEFRTIEDEVRALAVLSDNVLVVAKKTGELKTYDLKKDSWKTIACCVSPGR